MFERGRRLYRRVSLYFAKSWTPTLVIAMFVVALFTHQSLRLVSLQDWLDHTDQAIGKGLLVQKLILDAETGVRGFLLTDDRSLLDPYYAQNALFDTTLAEVKTFVADNAAQTERLDRLSRAFSEWRSEADRLIRFEVGRERAKNYFGSGDGRVIIDHCRQQIDDFLMAEQGLRSQRAATLKIAIPRTIAGGAALTLFLRLLLTMTIRALARRPRAKVS